MADATRIEHELDGTITESDDIPVDGDRVERLLEELLREHWARLSVGPIIEGSAWEIRFTGPPRLSMLDGYLTVDTGAWHFHLCVDDTSGGGREALARARRVARAAFFRTIGGPCSPEVYGLRLWNGLGEQMVTVLFPSPFYDDAMNPLRQPDHSRTALWDEFRERYRR
jgi:hypothetical protein